MIRAYFLLTKPGIILGNIITTAAGFLLASKGRIDLLLFIATLSGLFLFIGSACVFNNYIDRHADQKMSRTQNRALVKKTISERSAILFGIFLGLLGVLILALYTNVLALSIALAGLFTYLVLYTIWKYQSIYGTLVGSLAGAVPPVVGYCAVTNQFDSGALILFLLLVLWQMPHFFAIALYRLEDYVAASIPVLPAKKGSRTTKINMLLYTAAFLFATPLLTLFGYTGYVYLVTSILLSIAWLLLAVQGFKCENDKLWARQMFRLSLVIITGLSLVISLDGTQEKFLVSNMQGKIDGK